MNYEVFFLLNVLFKDTDHLAEGGKPVPSRLL